MEAIRTSFFFLQAASKINLRTVHIGLDGANRAFDDELHAHGSGEMNDHVRIIDKFREQLAIFDAVEVIVEKIRIFQMPDVLHASGRKIIQENDALALFEESSPPNVNR